MANFNDFNFGDDDPGPDTDPTPNDTIEEDSLGTFDMSAFTDDDTEPIDRTNYDEPGAGDSFTGSDPTVWDTSGNAERPTEQPDQSRGAVEISEQSATVPDGGGTFGRFDDPDTKENPGDEQTGSNEADVARPEEVVAKVETDLIDEDKFDEVSFEIDSEAELLEELIDEFVSEAVSDMLDLIDNLASDPIDEDDEPIDYDDEYNMPDFRNMMGTLELNDYIGDLENEDSKIVEFQDIDTHTPDLEDTFLVL